MDDFRYNSTSSHDEPIQRPEPPSEGGVPEVVFGATQGKKGHKAPRINMAFSPDNHKWIKARSRQMGISATALVNAIIDHERLKEGKI